MRLTIERMRTLVLTAAVLLLLALVVALALGKWKRRFLSRDLPQKLGLNITQEADGYTFSHALGAHSQYKIHAAKLVQLKDDRAILHDVKIELFDNDGSRIDRIEGAEFEYDQKAGTALAKGPVEITLMRPGTAPSVAPKASAHNAKGLAKPLTTMAQNAAAGEIHVKTSALSFDRDSGRATTDQRVDFSMVQGTGNSMGASYDAQAGQLVLDHAVVLNTRRGSDPVVLHAQHAEFERDAKTCQLVAASVDSKGDQATAGAATILFREDGSAVRLDATSGFTLTTAAGSHLSAPVGEMEFDERNQPRHAHLQGGMVLDEKSSDEHGSRILHGSAPTAEMEFDAKGNLHLAHLQRDVEMHSEETKNGVNVEESKRSWRSPIADLQFHTVAGKVELESVHGAGGVLVTAESQRGQAAAVPSRMSADELTSEMGSQQTISTLIGVGHASMEQTSANGTKQTTAGDRLEAHFLPASSNKTSKATSRQGSEGAQQIQSAIVDGHVVLTQQPAAKPGAQPQPPLHATSGRAVYEGAGELLHLTLAPRVEDGGLQLTADKIDLTQSTGDAFAHGNVKASWIDANGKPAPGASMLGGQGAAHVIAAEAQLHQVSGDATFRGQARLWQDANSVAAPVIVLNRALQTLTAHTTNTAEPVKLVLLTAGGTAPGSAPGKDANRNATPSVVRVRGGELRYSELERKALLQSGVLPNVTAEIGSATSTSKEIELFMLPAGKKAANNGAPGQVDRMVARGHVLLNSEGRRGSGEQLVFTSQTGEYVLTGTASTPPRITDAVRGTVTGEAVLFHSRDDSVTVEGGNGKTRTETSTPR